MAHKLAGPAASAQWLEDGKVLPHGIVATHRTLPRRVRRRLCPGLEGELSVPAAGSAKQPARGPHRRAVGTSLRAAQRGGRRNADGNVYNTPHYTSGDVTDPGCRCMGGGTEARRNRHVDGSVTGNSPVKTLGIGVGEDLGEKNRRRVPLVSDCCAVMRGRLAHMWRWAVTP
jgi:hypothetical protein